ncbi:hypothetical protein HK100_012517, partial [Physocladia obscura]
MPRKSHRHKLIEDVEECLMSAVLNEEDDELFHSSSAEASDSDDAIVFTETDDLLELLWFMESRRTITDRRRIPKSTALKT